MKHTPGKWKVEDTIQSPEIHTQDGMIRIATIAISGHGVSGEHEANANLISAAPELLEALKEMVKCHDFDKPDCNCCECRYAKKVITKAEGAK